MSKGGLQWLDSKTWEEVTREERFFCAELFYVIRADVQGFVRFLNSKRACLQEDENWEPAYEVCFYRDIAVHRRTRNETSPKRTFDLVLFSDKSIVLIEAKAQQPFKGKQLQAFSSDREQLEELTSVQKSDIHLVGLRSSKYNPQETTREHFDLMITWSDLASWCSSNDRARRIFQRADWIFGK